MPFCALDQYPCLNHDATPLREAFLAEACLHLFEEMSFMAGTDRSSSDVSYHLRRIPILRATHEAASKEIHMVARAKCNPEPPE